MVSGYFSKRIPELKMPAGEDPLGIRWEGAVMEGTMSTSQRLAQDRRAVWAAQMSQVGTVAVEFSFTNGERPFCADARRRRGKGSTTSTNVTPPGAIEVRQKTAFR